MSNRAKRGFTLIELVMVILLLGIMAAIAIPNFLDFRKDAKDAAVQGALGAFRSAIAIAIAAIQLREDPTAGTPKYPTLLEMQNNAYDGSHPTLAGNNIMDPGSGIPKNPWTLTTLPNSDHNTIVDCVNKGEVLPNPLDDRGWCYNESTGILWANSDRNGGPVTENAF